MATEIKEVKYKGKSLYVAEAVSDTNTRVLLLPQTENKTITVTDSNPIGNTYTWSNLTKIQIPVEISAYLGALSGVTNTNYYMALDTTVSSTARRLGSINIFNGASSSKSISIDVEAEVRDGGKWFVEFKLRVGNIERTVSNTIYGGNSTSATFTIECRVNRDTSKAQPTITVLTGQYKPSSGGYQYLDYQSVQHSPEDISDYKGTGPLSVQLQAYGGNTNALYKGFKAQSGGSDSAFVNAVNASAIYVKIPTGKSITYTKYPYSASASIS